ncbi:MAG: 50S ribosomal protein L24 [Candidatus Helarchaeota archaeon]|nr:50S ribosomal protein L24 [Candidatus Helarchaeota archaeon]
MKKNLGLKMQADKKSKTKSRRKQRKRFYNQPHHKRNKLFTAKLHDDLLEDHDIKRLPIRKDDTVLVVRGEFRDMEGKVSRIDRQKAQLFIDGASIEKSSGTTFDIPIHPSNVVLTKIEVKKDKWRKKIIDRKVKITEEF